MFGTARRRVAPVGVLIGVLVVGLSSCSHDPEKGKQLYLESGKNYMKKGKYQEASIQFRNAVKLDPRFVEAFYELAQAQL